MMFNNNMNNTFKLTANDIINLYKETGLNLIPCKNKVPVAKWSEYQTRRITLEELKQLVKMDFNGVGIVCGFDGVVCFDIDNHAKEQIAPEKILKAVKEENKDLYTKLYVERTPSGGFHLIYRSSDPPRNVVLARTKNNEVLIETRGRGGLVVTAPTPHYVPLNGDLAKIQPLTLDEEAKILTTLVSFDFFVRSYNSAGASVYDYETLLKEWGWKKVGETPEKEYWRHPSASNFNSATKFKKTRIFYVFSTNAKPFKAHRAYKPREVYELLNNQKNGGKAISKAIDAAIIKTKKQERIIQLYNYVKNTYEVRYNLVTERFEYKDKDTWNEMKDDLLKTWYVDSRIKGFDTSLTEFDSVLTSVASERAVDPIVEYFEGLDKEEYTPEKKRKAMEYFHDFFSLTFKSKYEKILDCLEIILARYFAGVVAQALGKDVNHLILTLIGKQGIGKTSTLSKLVPNELKPYYALEVSTFNPENKDAKIKICENFLINLDEIEASSKDDISALKSILSTPHVSVRPPYGHYENKRKRRASFVASANKTDFLNDVTGTRRFILFEVERCELKKDFDPGEFWRHAYNLYRACSASQFQIYPTKEEEELLQKINEIASSLTLEEELVRLYFENPLDEMSQEERKSVKTMTYTQLKDYIIQRPSYELLTNSQILIYLNEEAKGFVSKISFRQLGLVLKNKIGFLQVHTCNGHYYLVRKRRLI
jgi:predicted P-loop ATPase